MLKFFVAALLIGLAWAVVLVLDLPWWIALIVTVLVVAGLIGIIVYRRLQARKAARDIERALRAQADEHARSARPDQIAEIQAMQAEFNKAVQSLKGSRLGRGGADALYALPWYMIIGPPGAGKSTALRNSGLQFPYLSQSGGGVRGVGGTRNCEWWMTNEAVILDTAGRYTTEEEDRDEWLGFLDALRKNRPRKPVNGVIVAVSVGDLGGAHDEEVMSLGKRIRERIDEVMQRLQMTVPVYVFFTKCDLIPGFVETFGDMAKGTRGQIWGFTAPITKTAQAPGDYFAEQFTELARTIEQRAMARVGQERKIEMREKIFEFPQQFEVLKPRLTEFVSTLFSQSIYQDSPMMRGVYFTSGTQEGRPIDRVMHAMAEAFGIRARMPAAEPVTEPKSYFLRDVFGRVIFPDADVAARSAGEIKRQRTRIFAIAATLVVIALLVSALPAYAWYRNRDLLQTTRAIVESVASAPEGQPITLDRLEPLRQRVEKLRDWDEHGHPMALGLGMYKGDEVYRYLRPYYTTTLRRALIEPIVRRDVDEMNTFGRNFESLGTRPTSEEYSTQYDKLKMHLLLTVPHAAGEPAIGTPEQTFLTNQIVNRWRSQLSIPVDDAAKNAMRANVALYMLLLEQDSNLAFARDGDTVRRVRAALTRAPVITTALDQIIADVDRLGWDLTLYDVIGGTTTALIRGEPRVRTDGGCATHPNESCVRGAFTRRAWEERVRDRLTAPVEQLVGEAWVLGTDPRRSADVHREEQIRTLRSQYFTRYIEEWQQFISSIRVIGPTGNTEALTMFQDLTRGDPPPYRRLFQTVAYNADLRDPQQQQSQTTQERIQTAAGAGVAWLQKRIGGNAGRVAGRAGTDLLAQQQQQEPGSVLLLDTEDVKFAFEGLYRFGVPPEPETPPPAAGAAAAPPPPPPPVALDGYQEQLTGLRDAMQTYIENPTESEPLLTKIQTARTAVRALIEEQEIGWRPRFEALLWPPIEGFTRSSTTSVGSGNGSKWCTTVVVPFERSLRNRYPFNPNGQDAALADVADFYRPETGLLWKFYGETLRRDVERVGDRFDFTTRLGTLAGQTYFPTLPLFLDRSQDISSVFFTSGTPDPRVGFEVRVRPTPDVEQITFTVDGQIADYRNHPEQWTRMVWPGPGDSHGASIRVRGAGGLDETIQQDGEWGLYRLLEAGSMRGDPNARIFTIIWTLRTHNVEIGVDVRPASSENPFLGIPRRGHRLRFLDPFRSDGVYAPRQIARRGRMCNPVAEQ